MYVHIQIMRIHADHERNNRVRSRHHIIPICIINRLLNDPTANITTIQEIVLIGAVRPCLLRFGNKTIDADFSLGMDRHHLGKYISPINREDPVLHLVIARAVNRRFFPVADQTEGNLRVSHDHTADIIPDL